MIYPSIPAVASSEAAAFAQAERTRRASDPYAPVAGRQFTHMTTIESTLIPPALGLGITTNISSGALIAVTTAIETRCDSLVTLINRIVYILEVNGMTS